MGASRRFLATMSLVVCASVVSGCAPEPHAARREAEVDAITISVNFDKYRQKALGEVVMGAFTRSGREAYVESESNPADRPRISRLQNGRADLVLGCTGELLNYLDPQLARELSKNYVAAKEKGLDPNDGTWRDSVYEAMVGSLPSDLMATDPSNAQGCPGAEGPELPQNIVPVFREAALTRNDRIVLNKVTGGMSTDDLVKLVDGSQDRAETKKRADQLLTQLEF